MSAVAQWLVYCDDPECEHPGREAHEGDPTVSMQGITYKRRVLKREGWRRIKGKDICPDCVKRRARVSEEASQ
jgi:hypothetical protein